MRKNSIKISIIDKHPTFFFLSNECLILKLYLSISNINFTKFIFTYLIFIVFGSLLSYRDYKYLLFDKELNLYSPHFISNDKY